MIQQHRTGLTMLELLVAMAIVGLLVALLLSAVNSAREAARRVQCTSNLGQFGRALQDYHSANRCFPPALPPNVNNTNNWSNLWYAPHVGLLPYLEQAPLAASVNLQQPLAPSLKKQTQGEPAGPFPGTMVPWTHLRVFRCPSDGNAAGLWAGNSYRVCTGPGPSINTSAVEGPGTFVALRPRRPAEFHDGLSATIGAAEKLLGSGSGSYSRRSDFWYSGAWLVGVTSADGMAASCNALMGAPPEFYVYSGSTWFFAGYENTWYNHVLGPNAASPDCSWDFMPAGAAPTVGGAFRASSHHSGGVNSMFMDGSVRFIADNVNLTVWRAASTVSGGEAMSIDGG